MIENIHNLFAKAFENIYLTNPDAPEIQDEWMKIAVADEAFRKFAKTATDYLRSREGDSIKDPVDSAFLRGVALGAMIGYRVRELQEERS